MAEPVVGLSEVVKDDAAAVSSAGGQDDGGRGVGFTGHPGGMEGVGDEEESHDQDHPTGNLQGTRIRNALLLKEHAPSTETHELNLKR